MWNDWRAAIFRHVPALPDLMEAGKTTLGPAAGAALVVFAIVLLALGRRASLAAAALAMIVGFGLANYFSNVFPWWPEPRSDPPRLLPPDAWKWIPLLYLLANFDGLFARVPSVPMWGGWRLRIGIGLLAAIVLMPPDLYTKLPAVLAQWPYFFNARAWPLVAFTLIVALGWAGSECVARQAPGGAVGLGLSIALFGASIVVLHARCAGFAQALTFAGAALFGISLVAFFRKTDIGGALPGVALLLPAILLVTYEQKETLEHAVPWHAFLLAGLSPLTVGLLAIPPFSRGTGFVKWLLFWALCLGPTIAAVVVTVQAETLPTNEW